MNEETTLHPSIARVLGEPYTKLPEDLYIPPDALEVFLETFEGPLDLLLYLIKKQNLDILNIPIAKITTQYMQYIDVMKDMKLELAAEYLLMAAMLAEIKSRMLLPRHSEAEDEEEDPRAELARRLLEYERYKKAADDLEALPHLGRDVFLAKVEAPASDKSIALADVTFDELMLAFKEVLKRADNNASHHVERELLSTRERMTAVLSRLKEHKFLRFNQLFSYDEGRMGVVVTFIAILELLKQSMIDIIQNGPYTPIHIKAIEQ